MDTTTSNNYNQIRVIGAGLGRTGTKSLATAMDLLGYKTYHFPLPEHAAAWAAYSEGTGSVQDAIGMAVQEGYDATCDQPMADVFEAQLEMYPEAKVILTVRDSPEKWAKSWKVLMNFIRVQERPFSWRYPTFIQWIPFMKNWKTMRNVMGVPNLNLPPGKLIRGYDAEPEGWLEEQYEAHNAEVISKVPKEQLLIFNVKQGWEPLCEFLGKNVPKESFPNVNESKELQLATTVMKTVSYGWIPFVAGMAYVSALAARAMLGRTGGSKAKVA
mmetsp:Transcript_16583/g.23378  ORF Transcript_16583/g.23378 Transcript_16583/m.23378 type:complete len:272 (+) Transcript_16583:104-919(+)